MQLIENHSSPLLIFSNGTMIEILGYGEEGDYKTYNTKMTYMKKKI